MDRKQPQSEVMITHVMGGIKEARESGEYPDYYNFRSRKYSRTWRLKKFPATVKHKGKIVYRVEDELTVYDKNGDLVEFVDSAIEMRD